MAASRSRRGVLIGRGALAIVVGLVTAVALWSVGDDRRTDAVNGFARAPVGCDTTLDFVETGWIDAAAALAAVPSPAPSTPPAGPSEPLPFADVDPTAYYAEPIAWLAETGATSGTSPTTFSPDDTVTRGQLATFLWRLDGRPSVATTAAGVFL